MSDALIKILDLFNHLVRDILQYLIPGLILIGNIFVIDGIIYDSTIWRFFEDVDSFAIIVVLVSYGLGQVIIGVMYLLIERTGLEKFVCSKLGIDETEDIKSEIQVYLKNRSVYEFYIERYNQLYYLRWNMAGVGLIGVFMNGICLFLNAQFVFVFLLITSLAMFFIMMILHYETGRHMVTRIQSINKELENWKNE